MWVFVWRFSGEGVGEDFIYWGLFRKQTPPRIPECNIPPSHRLGLTRLASAVQRSRSFNPEISIEVQEGGEEVFSNCLKSLG